MELDGEAVPLLVFDALAGAVVGVHLSHLPHLGGQLIAHDCIAVVLAGDEGASRLEVGDRLIGAAVAVLELHGLGTSGESGELVAEADAEGGDIQLKDVLEVLDDLHRLGGVAGAVGEHDAVRVQGSDFLSGGKGRHDRHLAAALDEAADDVPLAAVVHQHDVGLTLLVVDLRLCTGDALHGVGDGVSADLFQQLIRLGFVGRVSGIKGGQDGTVHDAALPDDAGEVAGVDALDADGIVSLQKAVQRLLTAPVGRGLAGLADDITLGPDLIRLHVVLIHTVVADEGVGLGDDLAVVAGVGQRLLKAHHAGGKDDLAHGDALSAHRLAGKDHAICQKKICVH